MGKRPAAPQSSKGMKNIPVERRLLRTGDYCATQQCETVPMPTFVQAMRLNVRCADPVRIY